MAHRISGENLTVKSFFESFEGTRARLQRTTDGKLFRAWLQWVTYEQVLFTVDSAESVHLNDTFSVVLASPNGCLEFDAMIESLQGETLQLRYLTTPRVATFYESVRKQFRKHGKATDHDGETHEISVMDVSKDGIGWVTLAKFNSQEKLKAQFDTPHGPVSLDVTVVYSRQTEEGTYRCGVKISPSTSRVDLARWRDTIGPV